MNIVLIGFGAVGYVLIQILEEIAKKTGKTFSYTIIMRNNTIQSDLDMLGIKVNIVIEKDMISFLNKKDKQEVQVDWTINCAVPDLNISILEWCVIQKSNYMDLASNLSTHDITAGKVPQQEFHEAFIKHGLLGIVNGGISPGMTEILTAYAIKKYSIIPERYALYLKENFSSLVPLFSWSPSVAIDEMVTPAYVRTNGKNEIEAPFTAHEVSHHGKGCNYYAITQEELTGMISQYDNSLTDMKVVAGGSEVEHMKLLYDMTLLSNEKIGDTTLINLIKSKAPKAATKIDMINASEKDLIDDAGFSFIIKVTGSGKEIIIQSDFNFDAFNALKGTSYYGSTSVSYPTGVGAGYIFGLAQHSGKKGIYSCLDIGLELDNTLIEETINNLNAKGIITEIKSNI